MKLFYLFFLFCFHSPLLWSQSEENVSTANELLNSAFFSEVLENAKEDQDALGTQRVVDLEESILKPSLVFSISYNYSSNPLKAADGAVNRLDDGFTANFNLAFNLGIGEYPIGDNVVATPSFSLMQMRTYNDPARDFGSDLKAFDVDVQIVSFSIPMVLPDDFTLAIGHSYVRPIAFRTENVINYSNTPSVTLMKNIPFSNGDILTLSVGGSYTFSEGDTLAEQISDPIYYQFIAAIMENSGIDPLTAQPSNLQDSWTNMLNLTYLKPLSDQLTVLPSYTFSKMQYTSGSNTGREDYLNNLGVSFSYAFSDWFNLSLLSNYTWKFSDDPNSPEYEDFIGGIVAGFNYSF